MLTGSVGALLRRGLAAELVTINANFIEIASKRTEAATRHQGFATSGLWSRAIDRQLGSLLAATSADRHERETSILPGNHLRESLGDLSVAVLRGVLVQLRRYRCRMAESRLKLCRRRTDLGR